MVDLIDTTEMYLRTVYELLEEDVPPMRARIAERLHQTGPTVSQTVARMERDGLLMVNDDRLIELTPEGMRLATSVMRKHRLAERLLLDVIGLDWQMVHDEACRWEHVISDDVAQRIVELVEMDESPYGNPIPPGQGRVGLSGQPSTSSRAGEHVLGQPQVTSLSDGGAVPLAAVQLPADGGRVQLRRLSEHVQATSGMLGLLAEAGVRPGATLLARRDRGDWTVSTDGHVGVQIPRAVADGLFVTL